MSRDGPSPGRSRLPRGARPAVELDPGAYRRWFESPLGARVDLDEREVLFDLAQLRPGDRVLDLGCGDGNVTVPVARRAGWVVGLDRSPSMVLAAGRRLREQPGAALVVGDVEALPIPDGVFDVVLAVTVLCLLRRPDRLLEETQRVLRPGGRIVLGVLGRYSPWALQRRIRGLLRPTIYRQAHFFAPRELESLVVGAGFVAPRSRSAVFYPPLSSPRALALFRWAEPLGRRWLPSFGAFLAVRAERPPAASAEGQAPAPLRSAGREPGPAPGTGSRGR